MVCIEEHGHKGLQTLNNDEREDIEEKASQMHLSISLLESSERHSDGILTEELENYLTKGNGNYPREVTMSPVIPTFK